MREEASGREERRGGPRSKHNKAPKKRDVSRPHRNGEKEKEEESLFWPFPDLPSSSHINHAAGALLFLLSFFPSLNDASGKEEREKKAYTQRAASMDSKTTTTGEEERKLPAGLGRGLLVAFLLCIYVARVRCAGKEPCCAV